MKRLCVMAVLLCTVGIVPHVRAEYFVDTVDHLHEDYIDRIAELGIAQGYGHRIFRPDIPINRAEFLKILMLAVYGVESLGQANEKCFKDFTGEPKWYWPYACLAKQRGVIHGYPDGTFRGEKTVNLAEALKIAIGAWKIPTSYQEYAPQYWYIPYFEVGAHRGMFTYFPQNAGHLLTRSEMAYLILSMEEPVQDVSDVFPLPDLNPDPAPVVTSECGNGIPEPGEQCDDGNTENDDGCSSICVIVEQPVHHAALRVDQRPISAFSISQGQEGVALFAFDAIAGRQDAAITRLSFKAEKGSLSAAKDYRLYMDNNGDGTANILIANGTVDVPSGTLTFPALTIPVQDGYSTRVELRGTITNSSSSGEFAVGFLTENSRFVEAVGLLDGRELTGIELNGADCAEDSICWISVNTTENPTFSIVGRGNLYVTKDSTPVPGQQLLAGQAATDLLRLDFRATGEDIVVNDLRITAEDSMFQQLLLYDEDGTFPLGTAWKTDCDPLDDDLFCVTNIGWTIQKDEVKTLIIRGIVATEGQGIVSGITSKVSLIPDDSNLVIQAVGSSSQENLIENNENDEEDGEVFIGVDSPAADEAIESNAHKALLAKIVNIENSNEDPDQAAVPTGTAAFGVFTFFAAENNNEEDGKNTATIEQITFSVNATNVEFLDGSFALYNTDEGSISSECTAADTTGSITVLCASLVDSAVNTVIESGESIELALRGFVKDPQIDGSQASVLRASLNPLGSRTSPGAVKWSDEKISIEWIDIGKTSVQSTAYWSN